MHLFGSEKHLSVLRPDAPRQCQTRASLIPSPFRIGVSDAVVSRFPCITKVRDLSLTHRRVKPSRDDVTDPLPHRVVPRTHGCIERRRPSAMPFPQNPGIRISEPRFGDCLAIESPPSIRFHHTVASRSWWTHMKILLIDTTIPWIPAQQRSARRVSDFAQTKFSIQTEVSI